MPLCCCLSDKKRVGMSVIIASVIVTSSAIFAGGSDDNDRTPGDQTMTPYILDHEADRIDGTPGTLEEFKGDVILIVNVASKCGLTPQYEGLEALYREKKGEGFVILGFPANNFMGQEPGTDEEIAAFCAEKYGVSFPMFSKLSVKGKDADGLFVHLAELSEKPSWNFTKYLVDRDGNLVERFGPKTKPADKEMLARIDELLAAPRPESEPEAETETESSE